MVINEDEHEKNLSQESYNSRKPFPSNMILRNVVTLEKLFDLHNKFRKMPNPKMHSSIFAYQIVNIETKESPRNINLGVCCIEHEK